MPAAIPVDESAVARFSGPALVRARLHAGFLGRPYFTDVRLTGRAWPADVRFAYDDTRERLLVLSPRDVVGRADASRAVRSDLFVFDGTGKELAASEIEGRVLDALVEADGHVLAFIAGDRWSQSEVSLARLGDDGRIVQRSVPVAFDRVLGWDAQAGGAWILTGSGSVRPQPPHFIQRMTLAGLREPRLGPFESVPRAVRSVGGDVWVVETERHRVTRLDAASGQTLREYRDLNGPVDVTVDAGFIHVIDADRTQLTRLAEDGRVLWRVPRFHGLTWAIAEPGTGGGWLAASMFEGAAGGVLKFGADGTVVRVPATARPAPRQDWRHRLGADVVRSVRDGRLFYLEAEADAISILSADGVTVTRVVGFRFPASP